jgi:disulfide oxidoreductase YuzD
LKAQFGESVEVEYLDLADQENQLQFAGVVTMAEEQNLTYPLVAVGGKLRLSGSAQYYHILPLVEEALAEG